MTRRDVRKYTNDHLAGLFIFNIMLSILVLLNSAQYFKPFFYLGINIIFFTAMVFSIIFLGVRAKAMFIISIVFLVFTGFLKVVKIDIWAERASVYFFQSFLLGILLFLIADKSF